MSGIDPTDPMFREILLASVPPAPREPSERAKYLVHGYTGSQGVMLVVGMVFLVVSIPFVLVALAMMLSMFVRDGDVVLLLVAPFVLIFPGVGAGLVYAAWRANTNEIRAYREGVPVIADVTWSGLDHGTTINDKHPWILRWRFSAGGTTYVGEISCLDREPLAQWLDKTVVPVLYLREDPRVNTLYVD